MQFPERVFSSSLTSVWFANENSSLLCKWRQHYGYKLVVIFHPTSTTNKLFIFQFVHGYTDDRWVLPGFYVKVTGQSCFSFPCQTINLKYFRWNIILMFIIHFKLFTNKLFSWMFLLPRNSIKLELHLADYFWFNVYSTFLFDLSEHISLFEYKFLHLIFDETEGKRNEHFSNLFWMKVGDFCERQLLWAIIKLV